MAKDSVSGLAAEATQVVEEIEAVVGPTLEELRAAADTARRQAIAALEAIAAGLVSAQGVREIGALRSDIEHAKGLLAAAL